MNLYEDELFIIHLNNIKYYLKVRHNKNVKTRKDKIVSIQDPKLTNMLKTLSVPELIKYLIISMESEKSSKKLKGQLKSNRVLSMLNLFSKELKKDVEKYNVQMQQDIINNIVDMSKYKYKINSTLQRRVCNFFTRFAGFFGGIFKYLA